MGVLIRHALYTIDFGEVVPDPICHKPGRLAVYTTCRSVVFALHSHFRGRGTGSGTYVCPIIVYNELSGSSTVPSTRAERAGCNRNSLQRRRLRMIKYVLAAGMVVGIASAAVAVPQDKKDKTPETIKC